jgi:hypothetical protein
MQNRENASNAGWRRSWRPMSPATLGIWEGLRRARLPEE